MSQSPEPMPAADRNDGSALLDGCGRRIDYLRLSVTDRCDLRCQYCMSEHAVFLPKKEMLSVEELDRLATGFVALGVSKVRITGGEPLVRKGVIELLSRLGRHLRSGALGELTLTTNGSLLSRYAHAIHEAGVRRINVSLDTLDAERFRTITRGGRLASVLEGIGSAQAAGLKVKLNTVLVRHFNDREIPDLIGFAHARDIDLTLIEQMPLGETSVCRSGQFVSVATIRRAIEQRFTLDDAPHRTGGPARYVRVRETGGLLGFISPLTQTFCHDCNRVRVSAAGVLYPCLGHDQAVDLKPALQDNDDQGMLGALIRRAVKHKPAGHEFQLQRIDLPSTRRSMSALGG